MTATTFRYFAYGSNMLTERLKDRCRSAEPTGRAFADGWALEFSKPSKDGSGKATLFRKAGCRTAGVLFEIQVDERKDLDVAEGARSGGGYEPCDAFPVRLVDGDETVNASTYFATETDGSLEPYDWYLALMIAGAHQHELGQALVASLECMTCRPYPEEDPERKMTLEGKRKALEALEKAGFPDYRQLLRRP